MKIIDRFTFSKELFDGISELIADMFNVEFKIFLQDVGFNSFNIHAHDHANNKFMAFNVNKILVDNILLNYSKKTGIEMCDFCDSDYACVIIDILEKYLVSSGYKVNQ